MTVGADTQQDATVGPRRDYAVLAASLGATIIDRRNVARSPIARFLTAIAGIGPAEAWLAFRLRTRYDVIITDGEHAGVPLALLLRTSRSRVKHITIGHRLSSPKKRPFFTILRVHERIDRIALHSRQQFDFAVEQLGVEPRRAALIPYQVDTRYWTPQDVPSESLIVSAGLEYRDYPTLFRAVEGLDLRVVIGAASRWSRHSPDAEIPPPNVRVDRFDYAALRDLYARAALVVVPLTDVDNQAGVTTILEAMAMGKAVVVTQSIGQTDVVEDRRTTPRDGLRRRRVSLARLIAGTIGVRVDANGFYVAPGDAEGLRRAIVYLMAHPDERARLGLAGRQLAEQIFTVEDFAERMRALVQSSLRPSPEGSLTRRALYG